MSHERFGVNYSNVEGFSLIWHSGNKDTLLALFHEDIDNFKLL